MLRDVGIADVQPEVLGDSPSVYSSTCAPGSASCNRAPEEVAEPSFSALDMNSRSSRRKRSTSEFFISKLPFH
jgi:hypothetical protein